MDPLSELFRKYGSDKGGDHLAAGDTCHRYGEVYHELFGDRRERVRNVFEIGIAHGYSLQAWRDYFPNADIAGIDTNPYSLLKGERIRTFMADQSDPRHLISVMEVLNLRKFDLMVDDGSHEPAHQILSARVLLPFLSDDGLYVIEDIEPDCKPELIGKPVVEGMDGFDWGAISAGIGLGRAHCQCGCGGPENLVMFRRYGDRRDGKKI